MFSGPSPSLRNDLEYIRAYYSFQPNSSYLAMWYRDPRLGDTGKAWLTLRVRSSVCRDDAKREDCQHVSMTICSCCLQHRSSQEIHEIIRSKV